MQALQAHHWEQSVSGVLHPMGPNAQYTINTPPFKCHRLQITVSWGAVQLKCRWTLGVQQSYAKLPLTPHRAPAKRTRNLAR